MTTTPDRRDLRPSLRLLIAASRLSAGQTPEDVATALRLPLALVTLIAEELTNRQPPRGTRP